MIANALAAPVHLAALLLLVSGAAKMRRPLALSVSLARAGFPDSFTLARFIGGVECLVALSALVWPAKGTLALLAGIYAVFSLYIGWLLLGGIEDATCGCSASADVKPSGSHLVVDLTLVGISAVGVLYPPASFPATLETLRFASPIYIAVLLMGCLLIDLMFREFHILFSAPKHFSIEAREGGAA